jgi:transposase
MATLIMTAKLNDIDPLAWLADVLGRIAGIPQGRLHELLPWEWKCTASNPAAAQAA